MPHHTQSTLHAPPYPTHAPRPARQPLPPLPAAGGSPVPHALQGNQLLYAVAMNMLDIPFKECFTINTIWKVQPSLERPDNCDVHMYLKVGGGR